MLDYNPKANFVSFVAKLYLGQLCCSAICEQAFIMVALWNRADHYIFMLWFLSIFYLFSSHNLSGRTLDVYHTSTHGVALVQI